MTKIVHLSDFHLESETLNYNKSNLINALLLDLKNFICKNTLIIISGDLIDKSGMSFKDKELAFDYFKEYFIDKIIFEFPEMKGRIFIIPGNHDFDRKEVDEFSDVPKKTNFNEKPEIVSNYVSKNYNSPTPLVGLKNYKAFEKNFYSEDFNKTNWEYTQFENSFKIDTNNTSIGLSCLNTSWLCYDDSEKGTLFLSDFQVQNSLQFIKNCSIKIAVIHHPLEFLNESDLENVKPLIYKNYDLI